MNKSRLNEAFYSINEAVKKSSYKSFSSQEDLRSILRKGIKDLHVLGYFVGDIKGLKPKHIFKLVEYWKGQEKSPGTIKNCLSKFRELGRILENDKLVKPNNESYSVDRRKYVSDTSRAIHNPNFDKCEDNLIRLSMEGQYLFGLRREESIKFIASRGANSDRFIRLDGSWTKGGIQRIIPITNQKQREWINKVKSTVDTGCSLIEKDSTYKKQLSKYISQSKQMGMKNLHGLRHAYAQRRYKELTTYYDPQKKGWECPFNGGPKQETFSKEQKNIDIKVRNILTRELGHSRISILKSYLS